MSKQEGLHPLTGDFGAGGHPVAGAAVSQAPSRRCPTFGGAFRPRRITRFPRLFYVLNEAPADSVGPTVQRLHRRLG